MLKDRLLAMFSKYDAAIQEIVAEVLALEQEHISMERPRIKDDIDAIVTRVARTQRGRTNPVTSPIKTNRGGL